jgi:4a-hydroxytetrahydrobiopterin dehydratase
MSTTTQDLADRRCVPCEGGVQALNREQTNSLLEAVPSWKPAADGRSIRCEWRVKDFATALDFFHRIARIAEDQDHHPDLHLTGYRNVAVELSTHAIRGLSENDFILAAKIDHLSVELKK